MTKILISDCRSKVFGLQFFQTSTTKGRRIVQGGDKTEEEVIFR